MASLEQNRKILFKKLKTLITIVENNKSKKLSEYGEEEGFRIFIKTFFSSSDKTSSDSKFSGTDDLFKFCKKLDIPFAQSIEQFYRTFACDLEYAKKTPYCKFGEDMVGDYQGEYKYDDNVIQIYTGIDPQTNKPILLINFTNYGGLLVHNLKKISKDKYSIVDENNKPIGQLSFIRKDNIVDSLELTGKFGYDQFNSHLFIKVSDESAISEPQQTTPQPQRTTTPQPQQTTPQPQQTTPQPQQTTPQPSRGRYVGKNDIWRIGDRNELIKKLNDRFRLSQNDDLLTQDLLDILVGRRFITYDEYEKKQIGPDGKNLLKDKVKKGPFTDEDFLNENILLKKVIKESVRRNLKDIYYGT